MTEKQVIQKALKELDQLKISLDAANVAYLNTKKLLETLTAPITSAAEKRRIKKAQQTAAIRAHVKRFIERKYKNVKEV